MNPRAQGHLFRWGLIGNLLLSSAVFTGCAHRGPSAGSTDATSAIRSVLDQQVADWNAGDIRAFMNGYARSEQTRFASGGSVHLGWEKVLARYVGRYTNRAAMGQLAFSGVEVSPLSADAALVFGQWRLQRENDAPEGLFTLLFRKTADGWRVVHDHTSSAAP